MRVRDRDQTVAGSMKHGDGTGDAGDVFDALGQAWVLEGKNGVTSA
jgi:hypothetical protein